MTVAPMLHMEESASQNIDQLLNAAGWWVCDPQDAHITAHRGGSHLSQYENGWQ
jgi:hypothetical protein